jgi:hypothetical protein
MKDYANAKVVDGRNSEHPEDRKVAYALQQLEGVRIIKAGFIEGEKEGGLAIDYEECNGDKRRLVLGYNELGEWVKFHKRMDRK